MPRPLTPQQQRQLAKAQAGGNETAYLANHPGVTSHLVKEARAAGMPTYAPPKPGGAPAAAPPAAGGGKTPPQGNTAPPTPPKSPAGGKTPPQGNTAAPAAPPPQAGTLQGPGSMGMVGGNMQPYGDGGYGGYGGPMQYNPGRPSNPNPQPPQPYQGGPGGFQNAMNAQFGSNNPFSPNAALGNMGSGLINAGGNIATGASGNLSDVAGASMNNQWYGGSPIATAQAAAQQQLDKNLSGLRSRYGAAGGGNSARGGIAEGTAVGEMGTQLGAQLAQLGVGARQGDIQNAISGYSNAGNLGVGAGNLGVGATGAYNDQVRTALTGMLGAGDQANAANANAINAANAMGNMGNQLTGVGAGEQSPANLNAIMSLLGMFSGGNTMGSGSTHGNQASGFLGK